MNEPALPGYDIESWRRRIPLLRTHVPMNNCSHAPQTDLTRAAAERYLESWNSSGMDWDAWMHEVHLARQSFASLVGASADEIAICSSVSEATSIIASALDFSGRRRKVLVSEAEFPSVGQVWMAQESRGARVEWIAIRDGVIEPAAYAASIDDETALVSACHAYFLNGFTQDIARVARSAHDRGALVYVDAYQTLGTMPVDVQALEVDFLVSGNLKFLMGVPGIAFLYVRRALIERLQPTVTGWFGRADPFAFNPKRLDWSATATRFDGGTPPLINAYVARAGMEMIAGIGVEKIRMWHMVLAQQLADGGHARGLTLHGTADVRQRTATTAFVVPNAHAIEASMRTRGVLASARGPVIRLAPHFYSTIDDVLIALDLLTELTPQA
jgi:selenocysteine lyase/cysteine desulfurase